MTEKKTDAASTVVAEENSSQEKKTSTMDNLLKNYSFPVLQLNDKIEGTVVAVDNNAVYVDLGNFGSGIIYGKEIKDGMGDKRRKLEIGSKLVATVVDLENEDGYVELSIREALREAAWNDLLEKKKNREVIKVKILEANKGGMLVMVNNVSGFMPVSQLTAEHYPRVEDGDKNKIFEILKSFVGTEMSVCVLDAIKEEEKLIVSEKEAYKDKEKASISEFKKGDIITGEVSGVVDFGAFVKFLPPSKKDSKDERDLLEGLVHISQLDWKLIDNPRDLVKVGDKVSAKIIAIDETRISLSIRELKVDPWSEMSKSFKVGDIVDGTVSKINHFGAFVYLNKDIHGLAHISDFISKFPGKSIDEIIRKGETYAWQIMSLEPRQHRMGLRLVDKNPKKGISPAELESPKIEKAAKREEEIQKEAEKSAVKEVKEEAEISEIKGDKKAVKKKAVEKKEVKKKPAKKAEKEKSAEDKKVKPAKKEKGVKTKKAATLKK